MLTENLLTNLSDSHRSGMLNSCHGGLRGCRFAFQSKPPPADSTDYLNFKQGAETNQWNHLVEVLVGKKTCSLSDLHGTWLPTPDLG